jgi:hypothetical protein
MNLKCLFKGHDWRYAVHDPSPNLDGLDPFLYAFYKDPAKVWLKCKNCKKYKITFVDKKLETKEDFIKIWGEL